MATSPSAGNGNLNVALRMQADFGDAVKALDQVEHGLIGVGGAAKDAGAQGAKLEPIAQTSTAIAKTSGEAAAGVDRLTEAVRAAARVQAGQDAFIASLREQVALFGKSTEEVLRYRAAQAGVGAQAAPLILQLQNQRAAQAAAAEAANEEASAQREATLAKRAEVAAQDAFITGLREQVALQGKSQADVLRYRAAKLGVSREAAGLIADVEKYNAAVGGAANTTGRLGVSSKQTAAALRLLPAQFTDITTSLAGGQSPLLVLLQQGGQIKDSFGGIGPTLRTLTSLITPFRLGIAATAVAAVALGSAFNQVERETSAYNLAVQATGNASGATRGKIEALAEEANQASGISKAAAREIAVSLVQSGRLGIDTIANITKTVQTYGAVTGQTVQQASGSLAQLFDKPSTGAAKLNEQFHFLSLEQLRYIQQLEEQGRVEAAQLELSNRLADRLSGLARDNLGALQRAWNATASAAKSFWDAALDIGRTTTPEQSIEDLRAKVAQLRKEAAGFSAPRRGQPAVADPGFGDRVTGRGQLTPNQRLAAAEAALAKRLADDAAAQQTAAKARAAAIAEQRRIEVASQIKALTETVRSNREKLALEVKKLDEALKLKVIDQAQYDKLLADAKTRFKDPAAPTNQVENAFLAKQQELSLALAGAQNRLQNAKDGVTASEDRAVVALEAWLKVNRAALKIDDARVAKLRDLAARTDAANKAAADAVEADKRKERITAGLADVDTELAALTGNTVDAAVARAEERFRKLRADLAEQGDFAGLIKVDKVIDLERAKAELADLQNQVDQIFGRNSLGSQQLQLEVQTGLTNELDAKERLIELNKRTATDVDALIPRMRELAAITGNTALTAGIDQLALKTAELKVTTGTLGQQLQSAFKNNFAGALEGLATGTLSLGEAAKSVLRGIAGELAKVAAEKLAIEATAGLSKLVGGGAEAVSTAAQTAATVGAATALTTAGATVTVGATTLAGAGAGVTVAGGAIVTGATALAASGASLLAGAAAISASAVQLAAASAASATSGGFGLFGFADGGWTGPGGKYQPAGIVHAGEFVNRQEVVRQPGALPFLSEFNRYGMAALAHWQGFAGYAEGGLVVPGGEAASMPSYQPVTPAPAQAGSQRGLRIVNLLDESLLHDWATSSAGERTIINTLRRNAGAVKQFLA